MKTDKEPNIKFAPGDRVREKNKLKTLFVKPTASKEYEDRIKNIMANDRIGTVVAHCVIKNTKGARRVYIDVIWDGSESATRHEQTRLTLLDTTSVSP